jgi:secondary thiamine-phosphate synthase enzyme
MKIITKKLHLETKSQMEFVDITTEIEQIIVDSGIREGQVTIYSPHTTASIVVNHNEPMLVQDFMRVMSRLIPISDRYSHDLFEISRSRTSDGRSNGHSHCKCLLLSTSETLPIERGKMILTDTQSIFFAEMDGGRKRDVIIQIVGL